MKYLYIVVLFFANIASFSQDFQWEWAKMMESITTDNDHLAVTDAFGNVYSFATFTGPSATIGDIEIQNSNENNRDTYFVKYNSEGDLQWIKQLGGAGSDDIYSIATDAEGNVFVAGIYRWEGIQFEDEFFPGTGMFLAKYDTDGELQWVETGTGAYVYDMEISATGEIIIGGVFNEEFNFGGATITGEEESSHIYIAKLNTEGEVIWIENATGPVEDFGSNLLTSLTTDSDGNIVICGWFKTDPTTFDGFALPNDYWATLYVVKYDSNGNALWAKTTGNYNCVADPRGLITDSEGNIYVSGTYCGEIQFGNFTLTAAIGTGSKYFIVKYNANGVEQWARTSTGEFSRIISSVIDSNGELYVSGTYSPPFDLGDGVSLDTDYSAMFIARYAQDGTPKWVTGTGYQNINAKLSIAMPDQNTLYAAGSMSYNELDLGDITLQNTSDTSRIFVAKLAVEQLSLPDHLNLVTTVYPNPVMDIISIRSVEEILHISVMDNNARLLVEVSGSSVADVSALSSGTYFLKIITESGTSFKKIIKK